MRNKISLFYILLILIVNCFATDTSSSSTNKISLKFTVKQQLVEKIYLQYISSSLHNKETVCSLSKYLKITLCEQIFKEFQYDDLKIYPNKVAFFLNSLECEEKQIKFHTQIFFRNETVMQKMYPCYGRQDPVSTNYMVDDYYNKLYVSTGLSGNSVMVYMHQWDTKFGYYTVHNHLENFDLRKLSQSASITINDVWRELMLDEKLKWTYAQKKIEYIYLTEYDRADADDQICNLSDTVKHALCSLIFDQYIYKKFWIAINITAFYKFDPKCSKQSVDVRFMEQYKNITIKQQMLNCYARNRLSYENVLYDKYNKIISISKGPRENSVLVYIRKFHSKEIKFNLFCLIENLKINKLKPIYIDEVTVHKENMYSLEILNILDKLSKLQDICIRAKKNVLTGIVYYNLDDRRKQEMHKLNTTGQLHSINFDEDFNSVKLRILSIIREEITYTDQLKYLYKHYDVKSSTTIIIPPNVMIQKITDIEASVMEIILKSSLPEEYKKPSIIKYDISKKQLQETLEKINYKITKIQKFLKLNKI